MGTAERTESICHSLGLEDLSWKKRILSRAFNGCGNCELRYACISKILSGNDYEAKKLRKAIAIMSTSPDRLPKSRRAGWLASDIAKIGISQCRNCAALTICIANAHYAAYGSAIKLPVLQKMVDRVRKNLDKPYRLELLVQDVLDLSGTYDSVLVKRALMCFVNCRQRDALEGINGHN